MGKVASDKCHKWVFKEPSECEPNVSNYWQSSFDAVSRKKLKTQNSNFGDVVFFFFFWHDIVICYMLMIDDVLGFLNVLIAAST